jgi:pilus assembly protein FimV
MTRLVRWSVLTLLAAPVGAWALGLGDIELRSALNQPFQADIQLVSATAEELAALRVTLAGRETFERYGLDRPAYLSSLEFQVTRDPNGRDVIRVSSRETVTEPFVTMLVEATWPRGRLLREYTVLLDPPVLLPAPAVPAAVQPAQTRPAAPPATLSGGALPRPMPASPAGPAAASAGTPAPARAAANGGTYGPVQRAETLWSIAAQLPGDGLTMNQLMVGIFQANPAAFDGNMNLLRAGAVLQIPDSAALRGLMPAAATAEAQRQIDTWQGRDAQQAARLRLVPPSDTAAAAGSGAAPAAPSAVAPAADPALPGDVQSLRAELAESRRLLQLRDDQLQALQARLDALEGATETEVVEPPADAESGDPGVELDAEPLFADEIEGAAGDAPAPDNSTAAEAPEAPAPPVAVAPAPSGPPRVVTTPARPSLVAQILGWILSPVALIGLGLLAAVGGAGWYLRRRREQAEDLTGRWDALDAEVGDSGLYQAGDTARMSRRGQLDEGLVVVEQPSRRVRERETPKTEPKAAAVPVEEAESTLSSHTVINLDQADVIAEADFHMAYGLYDQAAELLSKALQGEPRRRDLKLKLLEVFFVWGNKDAFLESAQELRAAIGDRPDSDWDKVVIMGKQICPEEDLFAHAAAAGAGGAVDLDLDAGEGPALDFAFDERGDLGAEQGDAAGGLDFDFGSDDAGLDFALGSAESDDSEATATARGDDRAYQLDIGERTAAGLEQAFLTDEEERSDPSAQTTPSFGERNDPNARTTPSFDADDESAATQESPTIESLARTMAGDSAEVTMESPALSMTSSSDAPTIETPTVEMASGDAATVETPAVGLFGDGTTELPTVEQPVLHRESEHTAEIDLDDLGLDLKDLEDLPEDLGQVDAPSATQRSRRLEETDYESLLSATGVTQVLHDEAGEADRTAVLGQDDATLLAAESDGDTLSGTELLDQISDRVDASGTARFGTSIDDEGLDLNLEDLSAALEDAETIEQPGAPGFTDVFGGGAGTPVDMDVGFDLDLDEAAGTEQFSPLDPKTMTEVGTKLDLARAYIDMGDPEGARSILEEVLEEGDSVQRREAQSLIDVLSA